MHKRTTVLALFDGVTDAPPSQDFVLDAKYAELLVTVRAIAGGGDLTVSVVQLADKRLTLPFDGQTANFTVGKTVRGLRSGATGVIVSQTDNGATGSLVLKKVQGVFFNDEDLVDDNTTPGRAKVNSSTGGTWTYTEVSGNWASSGAMSTSGTTRVLLQDPLADQAYEGPRPLVPRDFRLKFSVNGTITDLDFDVELVTLS